MHTLSPILFLFIMIIASGCGHMTPSSPAGHTPSAHKQDATPVISPSSSESYEKAQKAYREGNRSSATQYVQEALKKDGSNYKALSLYGILLAFSGNPSEGAASARQALTMVPNYTQAHYDLALILKLGGQYDESIHHFQKVLDSDPSNTWSYYGIATNYADKGDKTNALLYLQKAMALNPTEVRNAASEQEHFHRFRSDPDFDRILHP